MRTQLIFFYPKQVFQELLSILVFRRSSSGGLILCRWLDAVDEIDAFDDVCDMSEAAQRAPALLSALAELEHNVEHPVPAQASLGAFRAVADGGERALDGI